MIARGALAGVLLDVDGTLVDTEEIHYTTWVRAFATVGIAYTRDQFEALFGLDPAQTVQRTAACSEREARAVIGLKEALFRQESPGVHAFPGASELLVRLREMKLVIALVSSTSEEDVRALFLPVLGGSDLVDAVVCKAPGIRGKPLPDLNLRALDAIKVSAHETAAVGDTSYDIQAAVAAGVVPIGIAHGGRRSSALADAGAARIARNLLELRAILEEMVHPARTGDRGIG